MAGLLWPLLAPNFLLGGFGLLLLGMGQKPLAQAAILWLAVWGLSAAPSLAGLGTGALAAAPGRRVALGSWVASLALTKRSQLQQP